MLRGTLLTEGGWRPAFRVRPGQAGPAGMRGQGGGLGGWLRAGPEDGGVALVGGDDSIHFLKVVNFG